MDMDPKRLIPLSRPKDLGLGLDTPNDVFRIMKSDPRFPPVYKIHGKNYVLAGDRDAYRDQLIAEALRQSGAGVKTAPVTARQGAEEHAT
jgi:hypothetical protein